MKNLLLICKFFPVEGGVSSATILFVKDLIKNGFKVHLLTNSFESEDGFKQIYDNDDYQEVLGFVSEGYSNKNLTIHKLDSKNRITHIPNSPIYAERLFGKGIEIIKNNKINLIFGWYYQPNGFVSSMLGNYFNIPVIINNAGSDLGRLSKNENLFHSYKWMIDNATYIISRDLTYNVLVEKFGKEIESKLVFPKGKRKIASVFNPNVEKINFNKILRLSLERYKESTFYEPYNEKLIKLNDKKLNTDLLVIGMYGKCGETKGSWDVVKALQQLTQKNVDFQFVYIMPSFGRVAKAFLKFVFTHTEILDKIWILPPIPYLNIPKFVKLCDIVLCLERDFPIGFHNVSIPFEVLSVGTCLCVSEESIKNSSIKKHLLDGINSLIIKDPKNIYNLSFKIEEAISSMNLKEIGMRGYEVSQYFNKYLIDTDPLIGVIR